MLEVIDKARSEKAESLVLTLGAEPKIFRNGEWHQIDKNSTKISEWNSLVNKFLLVHQKQTLDETGAASHWASIGEDQVLLSFYQNQAMMKVVFDFQVGTPSEIGGVSVPSIFSESLLREQGIGIVVSARGSDKLHTVSYLMEGVSKKRVGQCAVVSRDAFRPIVEDKMGFVYLDLSKWLRTKDFQMFKGTDIVIFDGLFSMDIIPDLIRLAESGVLVMICFAGTSLINGFRQIYSGLPLNSYHHYVARLSDVYFGGICQYRLLGYQNESLLAYEILMNRPEIKSWIEKEDLESIREYQRASKDHTGVLSLNQSLLQLIIRRKIEIKTAFRVSGDPDHLDDLLKKMGI